MRGKSAAKGGDWFTQSGRGVSVKTARFGVAYEGVTKCSTPALRGRVGRHGIREGARERAVTARYDGVTATPFLSPPSGARSQ
jgi:hypothetical protein